MATVVLALVLTVGCTLGSAPGEVYEVSRDRTSRAMSQTTLSDRRDLSSRTLHFSTATPTTPEEASRRKSTTSEVTTQTPVTRRAYYTTRAELEKTQVGNLSYC